MLQSGTKYLSLLLLAAGTMCGNCLAQEAGHSAGKSEIQTNSPATDPQEKPIPSEAQKPVPDAPQPQTPLDDNPKRILDIIPNFQTTNQQPAYVPLTTREKYILAYHQTVDFSAHLGNLFQAALQQASDGQPHYGQGWGPYAQRFGAAEADQVTSAFFIFGFLPHIFKADPRYFRKGRGSPWARLAYAASRTIITRTDSGGSSFNTSQVLGQLLQQGISTAYYPRQDRSTSGVFSDWGINLSYSTAYNALKEYYPDFLRWVFHRHPKPDVAATTPAVSAQGSLQ